MSGPGTQAGGGTPSASVTGAGVSAAGTPAGANAAGAKASSASAAGTPAGDKAAGANASSGSTPAGDNAAGTTAGSVLDVGRAPATTAGHDRAMHVHEIGEHAHGPAEHGPDHSGHDHTGVQAPLLPSSAPAVQLLAVTAGYDGRAAIENVSLEILPGSLVAILGPNGGGKSTALKVIAGLLRPWSGSVRVLGLPAGRAAHRVAYVPQAELVDWRFPVSVWDVVMMGRYPRLGPLRRPGASDRDAVQHALQEVGMADRAQTQIGSLSGGQRRRAFLARAIAADPDLYLLDEPVTGVDITTQEDLMHVLEAEAMRGKTIVATTHDLAAAAHHFDRLIAINRTVIASGAASEVLAGDVLTRIYGPHLVVLDGQALLFDDAHHHDSPPAGVEHHHDGGRDR